MSVAISKDSRKLSFRKGIHPADREELSRDQAIEVIPTPEVVRIPLLQHLGAPSKVCIEARAEVRMGQRIAEASPGLSANIHASVDGKTAREGLVTLPNGRRVATLPIKSNPEQGLQGDALKEVYLGGDWTFDPQSLDPADIARSTLEAGIVGMGGAAFPTHIKLAKNEKKPIADILVNGCECEPYLTADHRLMIESPDSVIAGSLMVQRATGAKHVSICIEDNKPKAIEAIRQAIGDRDIDIKVMKSKYPQGSEKALTVAALGRAVPTGGLPLDVGVVVVNVGTAASIARMVLRGMPLTHRIVTVTGEGIVQPKNLLVPIGTDFKTLIDACGGLREDVDIARIIAGGPMMGFAITDLDTPVTKGTSGITVLTAESIRREQATACVRCGMCVDVCPLDLVPTKLALAARHQNVELLNRYHIDACMECGCCAYQCPAGIPLVQLIRSGKILKRNRK